MKKILIVLSCLLILTSCDSTAVKGENDEYTTRAKFIYDLMKAADIQIKYIVEPRAHEYFDDVKDDEYYVMSLINAVDAGIITPVNRRINPDENIKVGEARELINKAYKFKMQKEYNIWEEIIKELAKMKDYKDLKDDQYVTGKISQDMMGVLKMRIKDSFKDKAQWELSSGKILILPEGIKASASKSDGEIIITLDWGRKPTGGYILKILSAEEIRDTIVVKYRAKIPRPNEIVTQVITYPKDSKKVKVRDINKDYKIIFERE